MVVCRKLELAKEDMKWRVERWREWAATFVLSALIITSFIYLGDKVLKLVDAGNARVKANYYLPVQNPNDPNELMALDVKIDAASVFAQRSGIPMTIILHPDVEYRQSLGIYPPTNDTLSYYIVFEGTTCEVQHPNPNPNFNIGYQCYRQLESAENGTIWKMPTFAPAYNSDGKYPLLLGTGIDKDSVFYSTENFVSIQPIEILRQLDAEKLGAYSGALSVVVAVSVAIIAVIWTRPR